MQICFCEGWLYPWVEGQKNSTVRGMSTLTVSPPNSMFCDNSISGVTLRISFLSSNESLDSMLWTASTITGCSVLPLTDVIVCLSLVVTSADVPIFFEASISLLIALSMAPVVSLNVTLCLLTGSVKLN